jgi:hypothetical protein
VTVVHPAAYVDGQLVADDTVTVEARQLTPGDVPGFITWADVPAHRLASGGVLLVDGGTVVGPVDLGDYVIRHAGGQLEHEPADGFWHRHVPAQPTEED